MLAKNHKLQLRSNTNFFTEAQRTRIPNFLVYYQKTSQNLQVIVIIPKKIVSSAAERNTAKRFIYTVLQKNWKDLEKLQLAIVLVLQNRITHKDSDKIQSELSNSLQKIH